MAGQDIEAGRRKAEACGACHGPDGNSVVPLFPILAGQTSRYLYLELRDFKEGRRTDPQMSPMAAPLTREDMLDLAAFFAVQKPRPTAFKVIASEKQWGRVSAVNVDTGKVAWKHDTEQPLIGGGLATAGGLFFFGEGNGSFNALDSATGKKLWSFNCGAGANAQPVSYMVRGKQYVAMGCGGNTQIDFKRGNSVFVFSLTD